MEKDSRSILDAFISSEFSNVLRTFNPQSLVLKHLEKLTPREAEVLAARFGLETGLPQTLEQIGKNLNLTRERIRQIEKEALKKASQLPLNEELGRASGLIFQIIENHGNIIRETVLLKELLPQDNRIQKQAARLILSLIPRFNKLLETATTYPAWYIAGFENEVLKKTVAGAVTILEQEKKPQKSQALFEKLRQQTSAPENLPDLPDEALESLLLTSKIVNRNPYGEWGLSSSAEIHPKDVGDKAYLVLKHHGRPEHYAKITEMINKQAFDNKIAHQETVHNELIKNQRFVLVGRGIYALREWGYQPGIVADIIEDILQKQARPLTRNEIVELVLKQRLVKKNTVIVGLSNKQRFQKTPDNKYTPSKKND